MKSPNTIFLGLVAAFWVASAPAAFAQDPSDALVAISLDDATAFAMQHQPQLDALDAEARAARQRAIAAGELPDPSLSVGISDLTIEGSDRFTLRKESDTQIMAGLRQQFPRAEKLKLRREQAEREAETYDAERLAAQRMITRETGLAWLDVWKAEAARQLARKSLVEADRQAKALEISYSAGRATQAEVLAARVDAESLREQMAGLAQ